ncbi:MAG: hypothetical protein QM773_02910 [Hyphomonadaceae bacterium]
MIEFRQHDFARDFFARAARQLETAIALTLARALHGGVGTLPVLIVSKRGRNRQPALTAFRLVLACRTVFAGRVIVARALHALDASAEFAQRRQFIRIQWRKRTRSAARATAARTARSTARTTTRSARATRTIARETTRTRSTIATRGAARSTRSARTTRTIAIGAHAHGAARSTRRRGAVAAVAGCARARGSATRVTAEVAAFPAISTAAATAATAAAVTFAILFIVTGLRRNIATRRSFLPALFFLGHPARFLGAAAVGFLDRFLFGAAAFLVGARGVDRSLAGLEFGFREVGLLDGLLGGCRLRCGCSGGGRFLLGLRGSGRWLGLRARSHDDLLLLHLDRHLLGAAVGEALLHRPGVRPLQRQRTASRVIVFRIAQFVLFVSGLVVRDGVAGSSEVKPVCPEDRPRRHGP